MTWLTPSYAIVSASIAVPTLVILYFLKLRRRDVEISTTLLWRKAIQDLQANAPFQRLRRNILLILQLIALAAVLTALGQPVIKGQTIQAQKHIILIDRSASMMATDVPDRKGGTMSRLEDAKRQALALVDSMREGGLMQAEKADEAMVIAFDTTAEVRQQFTSDKALLRRSIESIMPTEGPTSIEEAMRLAKAHRPRRIIEGHAVEGLEGGDKVTYELYTDGRLPDADKAKPGPDDSVEFHRIGEPGSANMAIVGLRSERSYEDPAKLSVFVAVQNNEKAARAVDVELSVDGAVAGIKSATIPGAGVDLSAAAKARAEAQEAEAAKGAGAANAGATEKITPGVGGVVFQMDRGAGALARVRLRDPGTGDALSHDVLALDNDATIVIPPAKKMSVAIVSPKGNLFISSALGGLPLARLVELTPDQFEQRRIGGTLGEFDAIILDSWLPVEAGLAFLPPGRFLVLGSVPVRAGFTPTGLTDEGKQGAASIIDWKREHPVLRNLNLDPVVFAEFRKVTPASGSSATALADTERGPAIFEISTADVRALVVPSDVAASNWPFDVSFVVFMASGIGYLGEDPTATGAARQVQPGSILSDRLPSEATDVRVKLPDGKTEKLTPAADGRIVFGPLAKSGVYEVSWVGASGSMDETVDGRKVRAFAANLLDSAESDVGSLDQVDLANKVVSAANVRGAADRKLWPWLILGALGVVMLEWFVYNRKVHI